MHVSSDPKPRPDPSDIARQHPRHLAPMPQEHLPRSHGGPRPFGPNIREIVPPGMHPRLRVRPSPVGSRGSSLPVLEQHPDPDVAPPELAAPVVVDEDASATLPNALDTLSGTTSKDVARSLGHPGGGVSNKEARRDWEAHQKAEGTDRSQRSVEGVL